MGEASDASAEAGARVVPPPAERARALSTFSPLVRPPPASASPAPFQVFVGKGLLFTSPARA
jgi:hypothetical protein